MKNITRYLAAGSVVALMAAFSLTASAQDRGRSTGDRPSMDSGGADACIGIECMPGRVGEPDRIGKPDAGDRVQRRQDMDQRREEQAQRDWNYDPNRHKRSRHKDNRYRYYYGGYWYLEPYWTVPIYGLNRVSCGEGREIVDDSGFSRVRTIECSGRNFTYAARRYGDTFRVSLNSRTGEIVSVRPM